MKIHRALQPGHVLVVAVSLGVFGALGGLAACKRDTSEVSTTHTTSAVTPGVGATTEMTPPAMVETDRDFMANAARSSRLEVALGHEALSQAASPDVKAFGERMMTEHSNAGDELRQLASKKHVVLPATLGEPFENRIDKLAKLRGSDFDRQYSDDTVGDQESDIADFRKASESLQDPELRAWAERTLPVLQGQLDAAREVAKKIKR